MDALYSERPQRYVNSVGESLNLVVICGLSAHLGRMNRLDPITRLNSSLESHYRIEREIGEGGMGTVYLADDLKHERKVAVKVLKSELAAVVGSNGS